MKKNKIFLLFAIFCLTLISSIIANTPKALAYNGTANGGGSCWLTTHTPNPVASFTVTSAADALLYQKANLSLHVGQGTTVTMYLNGIQLISHLEPNGPGGYWDNTWTNFDLTSVVGPLVIGTTYNFSCNTNNWSCTGTDNSCSAYQMPTCSISASPDSIMSGFPEDITVTWTTTDASGGVTLNGVPVPDSGSQTFTGVST